MIQTEIAVLRFGLGARPGDLAAAAGDPRGWLMGQIKGAAPLAGNTPLAASDEIFTELLSARDKFQEMKREPAAAPAFNPVRDAYLPHYRAQVLARAQSAALTTRPFAERLVHFWTNHFAVSADKAAVFGVAGTLENEAIRPHVDGRFVDLLTAVEQHPAMIGFLDNQYSVGKDSDLARLAARRAQARPFARQRMDTPDKPRREFGINENLAREILELHTLGVNGGYTQNPDLQAMTEPAAASAQQAMTAAQGIAARPAPPDRVSGVARMAATLMRSDGGPEVAVIEASGWDTHANQGGARGALAQRLAGLDKALRALKDQLGLLWQQTAVLVVTEFGRTAAMNGTRGTDHGTGGCAFLAGGAVRGGRVIADWPGLARTALLDHRDLRPTLDLRSVFKAVLDEHMRVDAKTLATRIFPDSSGARPLQGLIRA